jgi:hypothetical protein
MDVRLLAHIGLEDQILFRPMTLMPRCQTIGEGYCVGIIIGYDGNLFQVRVLYPMTSECLKRFSLPPISTAAYPLASASNMVELVLQDTVVSVDRSNVVDIAFVLPLFEVESGLFHMSGSYNSYFIRYSLCSDTIAPYRTEHFFVTRAVEPVSLRLFHMLNLLAQHLKKCLYHQGEAELSSRTFRFHFSTEAFSYIYHKLSAVNVALSKDRQQAFTMYYDSLTIEARTKYITKTYLRIVTKVGLKSLQRMLGVGIGLGITKKKPSKKCPLVYCTENGFLTSIELGDHTPAELVAKPLKKWPGNLVDFIYTEESRQLSCTIRYSKIKISSRDVVISRLHTAEVHDPVVGGAYVNANFHYNGELMTVISISNGIARCAYLHDLSDSDNEVTVDDVQHVDLPVGHVDNLVASFGT